eukprot:GFYU01013275.1.p1 GENE.GFYU01013275.1~~GFYU01013275.1.p1  ORF type:complete len:249 (+),score=59.30 GFYU01013275.1:32-748(+)
MFKTGATGKLMSSVAGEMMWGRRNINVMSLGLPLTCNQSTNLAGYLKDAGQILNADFLQPLSKYERMRRDEVVRPINEMVCASGMVGSTETAQTAIYDHMREHGSMHRHIAASAIPTPIPVPYPQYFDKSLLNADGTLAPALAEDAIEVERQEPKAIRSCATMAHMQLTNGIFPTLTESAKYFKNHYKVRIPTYDKCGFDEDDARELSDELFALADGYDPGDDSGSEDDGGESSDDSM